MTHLQVLRESELGATDLVVLATARCVLAIAGLLIVPLGPADPSRNVALTYGSLAAYAGYSLLLLGLLSAPPPGRFWQAAAWADVAFAASLVVLTHGGRSIFFFLFIFAILATAFDRGFRAGIDVTAVSGALFMASAYLAGQYWTDNDVDHAVALTLALIALGYVISYFGGRELVVRRRLAFLAELAVPGSPRLGSRRLIETKLAALCGFFDAQEAFLAVANPTRGEMRLFHHSTKTTGEADPHTVTASPATVRRFVELPSDYSVFPQRWHAHALSRVKRLLPGSEVTDDDGATAALAHLLEAGCIVTARYTHGEDAQGRLVLARHKLHFSIGEARFLAQCSTTLGTLAAGASLIEELVAHAAEFERSNISRNLHDTTIQPFIGLRMAAHSIAREFRDDVGKVARLQQLVELADQAIADLRLYTRDLRHGRAGAHESLREAVRRQAGRLERFYDIRIDVDIAADLSVPADVAEAAFHIVCEGLNNVVRHTRSRIAGVSVEQSEDQWVIQIRNRLAPNIVTPPAFVPRSIAERVYALHGLVDVQSRESDFTRVICRLPVRALVQ